MPVTWLHPKALSWSQTCAIFWRGMHLLHHSPDKRGNLRRSKEPYRLTDTSK